MLTAEQPQTAVMWECCFDQDGEPFCPTGQVLADKREAVEELTRMRATTTPGAYLVRVLMTRCTADEETLDQ
jgi:hypothetical protein